MPPVGSSEGLRTFVGQNVSFVEPGDRVPMFHNWQFDIQRELPSQSLVEVAYVGSRGVRLIAPNENPNAVPTQFHAQGAALKLQVANPFFGVFTVGGLTGRTIAAEQLLRPYPHFTGVTRNSPAFGNSVYHSLQVKFEKRLAHGVVALVSYTASKNITDLHNPRDPFNRSVERACPSPAASPSSAAGISRRSRLIRAASRWLSASLVEPFPWAYGRVPTRSEIRRKV